MEPLLLGDGAYPSTDWLLKALSNNIRLEHAKEKFNKALSGGRALAERESSLLLKECWCGFLKNSDNENEYLANVIISCFVLQKLMQKIADNYVDYGNLLDPIIWDGRQEHERNQLQMIFNL